MWGIKLRRFEVKKYWKVETREIDCSFKGDQESRLRRNAFVVKF